MPGELPFPHQSPSAGAGTARAPVAGGRLAHQRSSARPPPWDPPRGKRPQTSSTPELIDRGGTTPFEALGPLGGPTVALRDRAHPRRGSPRPVADDAAERLRA